MHGMHAAYVSDVTHGEPIEVGTVIFYIDFYVKDQFF